MRQKGPKIGPFNPLHAGIDWHVRQRFPGLMGRFWRVKSEVHLLSRFTTLQKRDRLKHMIRLNYEFRKRGQHTPPILFER